MYRIAFEVLVNNLVSTVFRSCCGVRLPFSCSWSAWRMLRRKLVAPTVFMWYFRTRGGGKGLKYCWTFTLNRLHSVIRWWAVCTAFLGLLQVGEGILFILWRYDRKLAWFVRNKTLHVSDKFETYIQSNPVITTFSLYAIPDIPSDILWYQLTVGMLTFDIM